MVNRKRKFVKNFSIMLSMLLLVFTVTGCGGSKEKAEEKTIPTSTNEGNSSEKTNEGSSSNTKKEPDNLAISPVATSITKYMELKGKSFDLFEPVMEKISAEDGFASLAFLGISVMDLNLIPLTMLAAVPKLGDNVWEGPLFMMDGKGRVEWKGDIGTFNIEMKSQDQSKKSMGIIGEYDKKTDSLKATYTIDGKESILFEYVSSGKGYVSQFYSLEDDGASLIKQAFDENNYFSGIIGDTAKPESIYKQNIKIGEDFVKNENLMVVIQNGKGYSIIKEKKFEY